MTCIGVIIPARNGERCLDATLSALAGQHLSASRGRLRVVVAVNGSTDGSTATAERFAATFAGRGIGYRVIETSPGRACAFNEAERHLPPGPRLYLDQDAVLSPNTIEDLVTVLEAPDGPGHAVHFAVPLLRLPIFRSLAARCYYRTFSRLPYARSAPISLGAYAVSAEGRQRWAQFPRALHSDDKFVRLHFSPAERTLLRSATYTVALPDGIRAVVRARGRYSRGNRQLQQRFPLLTADDRMRYRQLWSEILRHPASWHEAAVYVALHTAGHLLARLERA